MDHIDKKILYVLDKNSRTTFAQIAKKIGQSQETVRYRFNNLVNNGIIRFFISYINTKVLGHSNYQFLIKTKNLNSQKRKELIKELKNEENINWLVELEGNYDLGIIFVVKSNYELERFAINFRKKYSEFILKQELSINVSGFFLDRSYLVEKERKIETNSSYQSDIDIIKLDEIDTKICSLISQNSRLSSVEIAQFIGKSSDLVLTRLRNLKARNILNGFSIILNHDKIGLYHYKILLKLRNGNETLRTELINSLKSNSNCIAIIEVLGNWDLEVDFEIQDLFFLRELIANINDKFSELIIDYQNVRILKVHKFSLFN